MYRYNPLRSRPGRMDESSPKLIERIKTIVILVLVAIIVIGAVFAIPAFNFRSNANDLFVRRMASECGEALSAAGTLSRTAGTSSYDTLAKVRSRVYAMEVLNAASISLNGSSGTIINQQWFTSLNSQLNNYGTKLVTGMSTGDMATNLQGDLQTLYNQLSVLY